MSCQPLSVFASRTAAPAFCGAVVGLPAVAESTAGADPAAGAELSLPPEQPTRTNTAVARVVITAPRRFRLSPLPPGEGSGAARDEPAASLTHEPAASGPRKESRAVRTPKTRMVQRLR